MTWLGVRNSVLAVPHSSWQGQPRTQLQSTRSERIRIQRAPATRLHRDFGHGRTGVAKAHFEREEKWDG